MPYNLQIATILLIFLILDELFNGLNCLYRRNWLGSRDWLIICITRIGHFGERCGDMLKEIINGILNSLLRRQDEVLYIHHILDPAKVLQLSRKAFNVYLVVPVFRPWWRAIPWAQKLTLEPTIVYSIAAQ